MKFFHSSSRNCLQTPEQPAAMVIRGVPFIVLHLQLNNGLYNANRDAAGLQKHHMMIRPSIVIIANRV